MSGDCTAVSIVGVVVVGVGDAVGVSCVSCVVWNGVDGSGSECYRGVVIVSEC